MEKPIFRHWAHVELWSILANQSEIYRSKSDAVERLVKIYGLVHPYNSCFACQSLYERGEAPSKEHCRNCPLEWGTRSGNCYRKDSPYFAWQYLRRKGNHKEAEKYAAIIRDLPLKKNAYELYDVKGITSPYRPVFRHWAHKLLWDILAKNPEMEIHDAMCKFQEIYPTVNIQSSLCFACTPKLWYRGECSQTCPLDWSPYDSCAGDNSDDLLSQWNAAKRARNYTYAAKCAAAIRDLPLRKNVHDLYTVKETSDD